MRHANLAMGGDVSVTIIRKDSWLPEALRGFEPKSQLGQYLANALRFAKTQGSSVLLPREHVLELIDRVRSSVIMESVLRVVRIPMHGSPEDYGIVGHKVVTTAAVNLIADCFNNETPANIANFQYHGIGTGSTAEATSDTALVTELTTQYNPNNTRATGTQSNPSANVFRTTGTNTIDTGPVTIAEHGVFSQAATGGGTLLDRTVLAGTVGLVSGDSLQTQYDLTLTAGG